MTDAPPPASLPRTSPAADPHQAALDEYGYDLADYEWVPVRRTRHRADGWTPARQRLFIETLADTCSVSAAAQAAGMTTQSAYRLRRTAHAGGFARAWEAALHEGAQQLEDAAFDRAIEGASIPYFDRGGQRVGSRRVPSDRLLMFLLRTHRPDRYGDAAPPPRRRAGPDATASVAAALDAIAPAVPAEPHRLMPPDALVDALELADICDGKLPHWQREEPEEDEPEEDEPEEPGAAALHARLDQVLGALDDPSSV